MNREHLQQQFGIPQRVRFAEGRGGLTRVELQHVSGARSEVYLHGAHVTAWQPAREREVLFVSSASHFRDGAPIRGGIPVIFPQFGDGPLPKHGLVRTRAWTVERTALGADGAVMLTLRLEDDAQTRACWPHPFSLQLTVSLGLDLALDFTVTNPGPAPLPFQAVLHTYFQVGAIAQTGLSGLQGTAFDDFLNPGPAAAPRAEARAIVEFDRETDLVYINAPDRVVLDDRGNQRKITIVKSGLSDIVVWNPWIEKSKRLDDFGDDEYQRMVCVETGCIRAPPALAPGAQWSGRTSFACENG